MLDAEGRPHNLRLLIEQLNLANYRFSPPEDGRVNITFEWPEDLRERNQRETTEAGNRIQLLTFPHRCREILDGRTTSILQALPRFGLNYCVSPLSTAPGYGGFNAACHSA